MSSLIESQPFLLFSAALLAGLVLATVAQTGFKVWLLNRRQIKDREYLALRTAIILEDFSRQCMEAIQDCEIYEATGGEIGTVGMSLPGLAEYPSEASWDLFDSEIANRTLSFRNTVRSASLRIQASLLENRSAMMGLFFEECGICGADAFELARTLRARHGVKGYTPSYDYPAMLAHRAVTARAQNDQSEDAQIIRLKSKPDYSDGEDLPSLPLGQSSKTASARKQANA